VRRVAGPEDFATAVLAQIDATGELTVVNAGHPPPLLLSGGSVTELAPRSPRPPLGLDGVSRSQRHRLGLGDRLLLYTDGLTEARRPRDRGFFPLELVGSTLGTGSLPDGMEALRQALLEWTGGRLSDDVALVAAQRAPGGGGQSCSSTENTLPAGSVNHAIAGPLPRITPLSSWPNPG
jgi:serine phosphatase RsbU (regulator of sigma subunit)